MASPRSLAVLGLGSVVSLSVLAACGQSQVAGRACSTQSRPAGAAPGGEIVLGRVLFSVPLGAQPGDAIQRGTAADGRAFAKFGVYVFGDEPVSIEPQGDVDIEGWAQSGATSKIRHRVTFSTQPAAQCAAQSWRVYPGGLVYRRPQCSTVRVQTRAQTREVRFGLGTDCPRESP